MSAFYEQTILDSGVTVISEYVPSARTTSLGLWVCVGSRDEKASEAGMSHFMEHMLFKGTPTRDAIQISCEFEGLGAELNAFTTKETTCYYARFESDQLAHSMDILCDMLLNSTFEDSCIESEREVVLEEVARGVDTPEDYVYDLFDLAAIPHNRLGRPVIGNTRTVSGFGHDDCVAFHDAHYRSGNLVVAAAGNVDHAQLVRLAEDRLEGIPAGKRTRRQHFTPPAPKAHTFLQKDTEQANIIFGMQGLPADSPRRFAASILYSALGGGMSSRLFQEVREKRGLVYSVYSVSSSYDGFGQFATFAGTRPENIEEVVGLIGAEISKAKSGGITQDELERTCRYVCGQAIIADESTRAKMSSLGRCSVLGRELVSIDDIIARYHAVTLEDIADVAEQVFSNPTTLAIISPLPESGLEAMFA